MIRPGSVIDDRFEVVELADSGGMGAVYRGRDRVSGATVAVKVRLGAASGDDHRFTHEADVLAELRHSAVVRYIAHGSTTWGEQYLVMEWLEGEDLGQRLGRAGLTVAESADLARRVAIGLAALHERGIVHRDLKPSNLFLPERRIDRVKLLDFGLAHRISGVRNLTRTGTTLGTPGYMAPEQARAERNVDGRADVFSLGCVLFECLTGKPAFVADHPMGILAKILFEEAERVRVHREDIPPALDDLVARMLDKDRTKRPKDGAAVAAEIAALGALAGELPPPAAESHDALGMHEQRLVGVVLAGRRDARAHPPRELVAAADSEAATISIDMDMPELAALRQAVEPFGARIEMLADGSIVAMISGAGAATDLAVRAARCALSLRDVLPRVPMALATGRGEVSSRLPVGAVIDRGVRMLRAPTISIGGAAESVPGVRLDELSAGLLDTRFDVTGDERGLVLAGERERPDGVRKLLGRPSPCVGRERELRMLGDVFEQCRDEPVARAVLVTAPPGTGKSRLAHEWLATLAADAEPPAAWIARGDSMRAGSTFGVAAQIVRSAAQIRDGEPVAVRKRKLRARLSRHLPPERAAFAAEFLGEICGAPSSADESARLRAARQDALVMGEQILRAWEDWLDAETQAGPLVLVLEDLHWGDLPSVKLIDAALRRLDQRPLMVLALARPEVLDVFPKLWAEREVQEIRLGGLTRRASEKLVRKMLGSGVDAAIEARILDRAAGNAFFLEELIRAVAEGSGDSLPATVLAMSQARLEGMDATFRQVLRAASVFGRVFWRGGVLALLGGASRSHDLGDDLDELCQRELIEPQPSKFPGETEYVFRHALVREAAYAMLTDADRALGHRLAGEWLASKGEGDALVLAEHFELGGEQGRAVLHYRRAAEQALDGSDLAAATARAEKGIACGAEGEVLGALRLLQAEVHVWRAEPAMADERTAEALGLLQRGGALWCKAAGAALIVNVQLGNPGKLFALVGELSGLDPAPEARPAYLQALALGGGIVVNVALYGAMRAFLARMEQIGGPIEANDSIVHGWMSFARMHVAGFVEGDFERYLRFAEGAARGFEQGGDLRTLCFAKAQVAYALLQLGQPAKATGFIDEAVARAERLGIRYIEQRARVYRAEVWLSLGRLDEAEAEIRGTIAEFAATNVRTMMALAMRVLARVLLAKGQLDEAAREAKAAAEAAIFTAYNYPESVAVSASALLARGELAEARKDAELAMKQLAALGELGIGEPLIRLVHVEVLEAIGDREAALAAVLKARDRLHERAARIEDAELRASFLEGVAENARTLALAKAWT